MTRYDHISQEDAARLPGGPDRIGCANPECPSLGSPPAVPISDGRPMPPDGWAAIELTYDNGNVFTVFACSQSCQRAIAHRPPKLRGIGEPKETRLWTP